MFITIPSSFLSTISIGFICSDIPCFPSIKHNGKIAAIYDDNSIDVAYNDEGIPMLCHSQTKYGTNSNRQCTF